MTTVLSFDPLDEVFEDNLVLRITKQALTLYAFIQKYNATSFREKR